MEARYEKEILEREQKKLLRQLARAQTIIKSKSPFDRYMEIVDALKDHLKDGHELTEQLKAMLEEGSELERNLVDLDRKHREKVDTAWKRLPHLENKLHSINNRISCLNIRLKEVSRGA